MMKRFFAILLCCFVLASVVVVAAHAEPDPAEVETEDETLTEAIPSEDLSQDIIINDSVSGSDVISQLITQLGEQREPVIQGEQFQLVDVQLRSLNPVQPSGNGTLKDTLLDFIGDYDAVVVEYTYQNSQGMNQYLREIQPDYAWMISAALLIVFIYCLFRLGGALLCKR